jgi:radical SAM protein with 4Fe4S-binding SPASM domain
MALGPKSGTCPEEIILDLIVDWDGTVLVCCNDFLRQEPIGDLTKTPLAEILRGAKRQRFFDVLRTGTWQEMATCRDCKFDCGHAAVAA